MLLLKRMSTHPVYFINLAYFLSGNFSSALIILPTISDSRKIKVENLEYWEIYVSASSPAE